MDAGCSSPANAPRTRRGAMDAVSVRAASSEYAARGLAHSPRTLDHIEAPKGSSGVPQVRVSLWPVTALSSEGAMAGLECAAASQSNPANNPAGQAVIRRVTGNPEDAITRIAGRRRYSKVFRAASSPSAGSSFLSPFKLRLRLSSASSSSRWPRMPMGPR